MREQSIVLAGGCFWGMQELFRKIPGVITTEVGYAGGETENPNYEAVSSETTGHAESIKIIFDADAVSLKEILNHFFMFHDPTTVNKQGNDIGTRYRSAIFTANDEQASVAQERLIAWDKSGEWPKPIVTEITPLTSFTKAEEYHQDYLQKHPSGYTCHFIRKLQIPA